MSTLRVNTIQPVAGTPNITSSEIATLSRIMLGNSSQTWTNVSSSRVIGTTYTNSTGAPIFVAMTPNGSANMYGHAVINGSQVMYQQFTPSGGGGCAAWGFVVPNGSTYAITNSSNVSIALWWELR